MEWAPKFLDNLDSAVLALYQSWVGYYQWVFLRLMLTVVGVSAIVISPTIRILAIAIVTTYISAEMINRLVIRHRKAFVASAGSPVL
jgi:hypothetical protein